MTKEYLLSEANKYDRSEATMKITTEKLKDNQINIDWLKPSKTYLVAEKLVFLMCLASWFVILGLILFS